MAKRIKNQAESLTKDQIADLVEQITHAQVQLDQLTARQNRDLDAVRDRYKEQIEAAGAAVAEKTALIESWAKANKDLFIEKRSMEFAHGTIGFRLGNWAVRLVKTFKIADAISALLKLGWGERYVIQQPKLDKDALLRDREILGDKAAKAGIEFAQDERFYLEPRLDNPVGVGQ